jgi:hypothetical protein
MSYSLFYFSPKAIAVQTIGLVCVWPYGNEVDFSQSSDFFQLKKI